MRTPFLILHGDQDRLCNVEGSRQLQEKAVVVDKTLKEFRGAIHNLYIEPEEVREEGITFVYSGFDRIASIFVWSHLVPWWIL